MMKSSSLLARNAAVTCRSTLFNSTKIISGSSTSSSSSSLISHYSTTYQQYNNKSNNNNNNNHNFKYSGAFTALATAAFIIGGTASVLCECFEEHDDHIVQIKTGYKYPKRLVSDNDYKLVVIGTRVLSMFRFNVYSLGMYINEEEAKKLLLELSKKEQSDFCKQNDVVLEQLLSNGTGLCIKIRPTRKVTWDHIYNGFEGTIADMLWRKYQMDLTEVEVLMKQLKSAFPTTMDVPNTSEIDFLRKNGDTIAVLYDNKPVIEITDKRFASTFFEFYLGDRSKVPQVRKEFYEQLWKLLQPSDTENYNRIGLH